jgi:NADPH2:quinone reductase
MGLRAGEANRRDPELQTRTTVELRKLAAAGIMRPHISHRLPLDQTREALLVLERREAIGRVVICIDA